MVVVVVLNFIGSGKPSVGKKVVVVAKRWGQCRVAAVAGCVKPNLAQSSYFTLAFERRQRRQRRQQMNFSNFIINYYY